MSPLVREALARLNEANAEAASVLEMVHLGNNIANKTVIAVAVDKCRVARFGLLEARRDSFGKPKGLSRRVTDDEAADDALGGLELADQ